MIRMLLFKKREIQFFINSCLSFRFFLSSDKKQQVTETAFLNYNGAV